MNVRYCARLIGLLLLVMAAAMATSLIWALIDHDLSAANAFVYSIIITEEKDERQLKMNIDQLRKEIRNNGQDLIIIKLTGEYQLLRLVSAYLMGFYCVNYLKKESQEMLDNF